MKERFLQNFKSEESTPKRTLDKDESQKVLLKSSFNSVLNTLGEQRI
jgi:hypothetical protein